MPIIPSNDSTKPCPQGEQWLAYENREIFMPSSPHGAWKLYPKPSGFKEMRFTGKEMSIPNARLVVSDTGTVLFDTGSGEVVYDLI